MCKIARIAVVILQKSGHMHRGVLCLPYVVLQLRIIGDILQI
jgi:hypothetical protein